MAVTSPKRFVGYIRVSSARQAKSGLGMADQKARIEAAAGREGWTISEWAVDAGETGKHTDRPEFRRAVQVIASHEADGLVAAKLDRICRSVVDFAHLLEWFTRGHKALVILDPAIDTTTASGRLVANVFAAVAEWEADTIGDRTSAALLAKRAAGLSISRPAVADDPSLLGRMLAMKESGLSLHAIARQLTEEGVPTLRGGAEWRASSVQSALGYKRPKVRKSPDLPSIRRPRSSSRKAD